MRPQEVCLFVCLFVCPQMVIFNFPDLIPEKKQYPCIFGQGLRFANPPDAIGFTLVKK